MKVSAKIWSAPKRTREVSVYNLLLSKNRIIIIGKVLIWKTMLTMSPPTFLSAEESLIKGEILIKWLTKATFRKHATSKEREGLLSLTLMFNPRKNSSSRTTKGNKEYRLWFMKKISAETLKNSQDPLTRVKIQTDMDQHKKVTMRCIRMKCPRRCDSK